MFLEVPRIMGERGKSIVLNALVADDDDDWRDLAADSLRRAGLKVHEAADGEQLVERCLALRMRGEPPVVIISDLQMPGLNGFDAAVAIRKLLPTVPFVLVTGALTPEAQARARELGVTLALEKPTALASLGAVAAAVLGVGPRDEGRMN